MFTIIALAFSLLVSPVATDAGAPKCETFTRLDGTKVTVCDGKVTRVADNFGVDRAVVASN